MPTAPQGLGPDVVQGWGTDGPALPLAALLLARRARCADVRACVHRDALAHARAAVLVEGGLRQAQARAPPPLHAWHHVRCVPLAPLPWRAAGQALPARGDHPD